MPIFEKYKDAVDNINSVKFMGTVIKQVGLTIESHGPQTEIGELCYIRLESKSGERSIPAEVVGFNGEHIILMPYEDIQGVYPGAEVLATGSPLNIKLSENLLGRVINGLGKAVDGKEDIASTNYNHIFSTPPPAMERAKIRFPLITGVRAIDAFTTVGKGQRIGIFSGAGVGKSTLLGMIARNTSADINVIALIGERGREVREFIERDLGKEGLKKSVIVAATSDTTPLMRVRGAYVAATVAEYFRDKGLDVALYFDSVTRLARAQREIGLAVGEPPTTSGFTPSVFALMPKLLERAGTSKKGSITGLFTVLVEGDDFTEPVSDTVRGIIDGHIILNRELAYKNHYPAIDILGSISRLMVGLTSEEFRKVSGYIRKLMAVYKENEDLITIGAYQKGSDPLIDRAIELQSRLNDFLEQGMFEKSDVQNTGDKLFMLLKRSERNGLRFELERDFPGVAAFGFAEYKHKDNLEEYEKIEEEYYKAKAQKRD
jgi:flagellum-specific ATP synthase